MELKTTSQARQIMLWDPSKLKGADCSPINTSWMKRDNQTPLPWKSVGEVKSLPLLNFENVIFQPFDAFINRKKKHTKEQDGIISFKLLARWLWGYSCLPGKPEDLTWPPAEEENSLLKAALWPLHSHHSTCTPTLEPRQNNNEFFWRKAKCNDFYHPSITEAEARS